MPRAWQLAELTYRDVLDHRPEVVVLPFGATEPHNFHLPYGTDVFEADTIADRSAALAHARGAKVLVLPTIPFGTQTNQAGLPLAMNLNPSTLLVILRDLVQSLEASGVRKCLILNSHGGNTFKGHLRELYGTTSVHLFLCNWFTMCKSEYGKVFTHADDHAGEMETSFILHIRPELVKMEQADARPARKIRFAEVRDGSVELTRPWTKLTPSTGVGDPTQGTADKGKKWVELVSQKLADFLVELSNTPIDDDFPFEPQ